MKGTEKVKVDEKKILAGAKRDAQKWLDAFTLDGKSDVDGIVKELSQITFEGKPCIALVVENVEDCLEAIAFGVSLFCESKEEAEKKIKELKAEQCIWDYYSAAFYACAYAQLPVQDNEFMKHGLFKAFEMGLGFVVNLGSLLVGVTRPEAYRDEELRIHREDGPAIIWGTWRKWFWHGVEVDGKWIAKKEDLTKEDFVGIENQEKKRAFCEIVGWDRLTKMVGFKKLQNDDWGDLIEADFDDDEGKKARFADVRCPSTDRRYLIRTDPQIKTCQEALARSAGIEMMGYEFGAES